MKNLKLTFTKDKLCLAALIILLASIVLPVVIGCRYSLPAADDFSCSWTSEDGNLLVFLFNTAKHFYLNWQGTYFGVTIGALPIYYLGGLTGIRVFYTLITIAFFAALFIFVREGCRWADIDSEKLTVSSLAFMSCVSLLLITGNYENEIFYWLAGIGVYTLPLTMAMLAVACFIAYERKQSNKFLVAGSILAILGAGGALCVSALLCAMLLFLIIYDFFIRKIKSKNVIIGIFALAGSLANSLAPGNFIRSTYFTDDGLHVLSTVKVSLAHAFSAVHDDILNGLFLPVLLAVFFVSYAACKKSETKFKYPGLVTLYAFFVVFISSFPVFLGYNIDSDDYFPPRIAFSDNLAVIVAFSFCVAYWGGYCATKELFSLKKEHYVLVAIMLVLSLSSVDFLNIGSYKMLNHMLKGDFAAVEESELDMLRQIEASEGGDVVVYYTAPAEGTWSNLKTTGLVSYAESTNWVNQAIARFYGVDSIYVVPSENVE